MSGGIYNYAYIKLEDFAGELRTRLADSGSCAPPHVRAAFAAHLEQCAKAMRAIEWNDSGDGADDEEALIRECLHAKQPRACLIDEALDVMKRLALEIERATG